MHTNRSALSSRERVRLALNHQETDRIPLALVCGGINPPAYREFDSYLQRECGLNAAAYLDGIIDVREVEPPYVGPPLPAGVDIWGVQRQAVSYGSGSYDEIVGYPLKEIQGMDDVRNYAWPTTDLFDYSGLDDRIRAAQADGDYCLMISNGNIFESSWYMRGFENMFLDLVVNPDLAHAIMERVTTFFIAHFTRMLEVADGRVDLAFTADDIGGQNGLLMSLDMWEQHLKPYHARLNKAIHEFGASVIYHTDGAVMPAVDGLIDMGIDVLQALQFSAKGMDPQALKEGFGDRLCFEGGVSVQTTLPFGTAEAVRQETLDLMTILGKDGGYLLGPSHYIQAGTPPENIFAMFDTALNCYPYASGRG